MTQPLATLLPRAEACEETASQVSGYTMAQGTQSYLSPEAMAGRNYDCATDIFSLGCVLLELLTLVRKKNFPHPELSKPDTPTVRDCVETIFEKNPTSSPAES